MTMTLIETVTLTSAASSIEFTSIPQDGVDLLLVFSARQDTGSQTAFLALNNSTSNFGSRALVADGSAVYTEIRTDSSIGYAINWNTTTANTFSNVKLFISNYAGSTNKSFSVDYVTENNATLSNQGIVAGLWSNTTAITSLKVNSASGSNFVSGSTASLYKVS